jgi:hypothetical protein
MVEPKHTTWSSLGGHGAAQQAMSIDEVAKQQTATPKNHYDGECLKWIPEV